MSLSSPSLQNDEDTPTMDPHLPSRPLSPASTSEKGSDNSLEHQPEKSLSSPHPIRKYTRSQLISLSNSPLVKPPSNMPELKVWFGSETENVLKKDDLPTPSAARERRYRRDADDGDTPRLSFRSAVTQTSQMGNFKHQSLRSNDRDRDRDREGDSNKETQSLRNASEKYDRDKLAQPLTNARAKERDPAPHLGSSSARTIPPLSSNAASRRAETRETAKKKVGEASEDWRRGAEPPRTTREDRTETGKREDRTRSRVEESSTTKRDSSATRKDRDSGEPRERAARGDDHRREKDDSRRDRDLDSEDDPRRWKDDAKRDDRLAARRERGRDKAMDDHKWDGAERRWPANDEKDGRYKRVTGRERKVNADDGKDRDDRRDKGAEREKEPAWMDNYVPTDSSPGILGGQSSSGELDGIQAWKKGLKEKESKDKDPSIPPPLKTTGPLADQSSTSAEKPMDEIQLFKLLMKKEQEIKRPDNGSDPLSSANIDVPTVSSQRQRPTVSEATSLMASAHLPPQPQASRVVDLSGLSSEPSSSAIDSRGATSSNLPQSSDPSQDRNPSASRMFAPDDSNGTVRQPADRISSPSFQPPPGSRLLAFARVPPKTPVNPTNTSQPLNGGLQNILPDQSQAYQKIEPARPSSGFSPFEEQMRQSYAFDDARELGMQPNHPHIQHRQSMDSGLGTHPEQNYNNMAAGKVSRFAKFFDGKSRDGAPPPNKLTGAGGPMSSSPLQSQRPDQANFGGINPNNTDRTVEELFAMLNTSAHQRANLPNPTNAAPLMSNGVAFSATGANMHVLQQQHQHQQHQQQHQQHQQQQHHLLQQTHLSNRLESLYDSRNEDRSFVPDGMVPGLRPLPPPPRGRDNAGHFSDQLDEPLHYNIQRMTQQQQGRNVDPLYAGQIPPLFAQQQQAARHNVPLQSLQPQYRGGPSPGLHQVNPIVNVQQQQRLPPGLANLGGRPPHEPAQFLALQGHPSGNPHGPLHANPPLSQQQLPFNNFNVGNNVGFNGAQQVRGPGPASHLLNNGAQQHPLGNLAHPNMDPRLANHHHLMGLGGSGVGGNRINGGFPQQGPPAPSHIPMRPQQQQQQQQHLLPHMLPHLLPPHLPQQGHPSSNSQQAHDLMALLMGGPHRE